MDVQKWRLAQQIFGRLLDLDTRSRGRQLVIERQEQPTAAEAACRLLAIDDESNTSPALVEGVPTASTALREILSRNWIGRTVGAYTIVEPLAEGGMGAVFLGRRSDGLYEQTVAIKLVRSELEHDAEACDRFHAERQVLANLQHPKIAHLLDGGVTEDGVPYLVMEHVVGEAIHQACDRRRLTISDRVSLLRDVAEAVGHAHRQLIIHCDLKPSNILVTNDGQIKLIDFGIARLAGSEAAALRDAEAGQALTPGFASPEQVAGAPLSTASDVYSLGAVAFTLLTGTVPRDETADAAATDFRYATDASGHCPTASVAVRNAPDRADLAARRATSPRRLEQQLAGDLDAILLKALARSPGERYEATSELARDLECWQSSRPVSVHPPNLVYRCSLAIRRNPWLATMAAALLVVSLLFTVQLGVEKNRALAEAERTRAARTAISSLFELANPAVTHGQVIAADELLLTGVERVTERLRADPQATTQVYSLVGDLLRQIGKNHEAAELYGRALQSLPADTATVERAVIEVGLGSAWQAIGRDTEAARVLDSALASLAGAPDEYLTRYGFALERRANLHQRRGEATQARNGYLRAQQIYTRQFGGEDPKIGQILTLRGSLEKDLGEYVLAETYMAEGLRILRQAKQLENPIYARTLNNLGALYTEIGNCAKATDLLAQSLAVSQTIYGDSSRLAASALTNMGSCAITSGSYDEASAWLNRALAMKEELYGPKHSSTALTRENLAALAAATGDHENAIAILDGVLADYKAQFGESHLYSFVALTYAGRYHFEAGDIAMARSRLTRAHEISRQIEAPATYLAMSLVTLAHIAEQNGDLESCRDQADQAIRATRAASNLEDHNILALETRSRALLTRGTCNAAGAKERQRDWQQALDLARRLEKQSPGNVDFTNLIAEIETCLASGC